jgi:hypothetical protein
MGGLLIVPITFHAVKPQLPEMLGKYIPAFLTN